MSKLDFKATSTQNLSFLVLSQKCSTTNRFFRLEVKWLTIDHVFDQVLNLERSIDQHVLGPNLVVKTNKII